MPEILAPLDVLRSGEYPALQDQVNFPGLSLGQ
jgi:hypothetical protein